MNNNHIDLRAERAKAKRRKKRRQKRVLLCIIALILVAAVSLTVFGIVKLVGLIFNKGSSDNSTVSSAVSGTGDGNTLTEEQIWMQNEVNQWYLYLVNPDNAVSKEFINSVDKTKIDERFVESVSKESCIYFDSRAVEALNSICEAALKDGVNLTCISTFRTYNYQKGLFDNRVNRYINQGYSKDEATAAAATVVALPGTSEHNLGLAVDFNSVETSFENTKAFDWLQENAEDYGFILRYPKDKTEITKIIYEPWHYRYVGVEHAKRINDLDMCLEEYIEYLKNGGKK